MFEKLFERTLVAVHEGDCNLTLFLINLLFMVAPPMLSIRRPPRKLAQKRERQVVMCVTSYSLVRLQDGASVRPRRTSNGNVELSRGAGRGHGPPCFTGSTGNSGGPEGPMTYVTRLPNFL